MGANIQMRLHKGFDSILTPLCSKCVLKETINFCGNVAKKTLSSFIMQIYLLTYLLFQLSAKNIMRLNDKADTFFLQITNQNLDKIPIHLFMNCMLSLINVNKITNSILLIVCVFFIQFVFLLCEFNLTLCPQFIAYNLISDTKMSENGQ